MKRSTYWPKAERGKHAKTILTPNNFISEFIIVIVLILCSIILPIFSNAQLTVSGPNSGSSITTGTGNSWSNPTNAASSNASYATYSVSTGFGSSSATTADITVKGFSFSIPSSATIKGVKVELQKYSNNNSGNDYTRDNTLILVSGASQTDISSNKADASTKWATSSAYYTYGGSTDLWSATLTPAIINASNFGLRFRATVTTNSWFTTTTAYIDHIRITVYYDIDSDGDGVLNSVDLDTDNDGIPDYLEVTTCSGSQALNWNAVATGTDPADVTVTNSPVDMTVTSAFTAGANVATYEVNDYFTATTEKEIHINQTPAAYSDKSTTTINFSYPIFGVSFKLQDLDYQAGTWIDSVKVTLSFKGQSFTLTAAQVTTSLYNTYKGNNLFIGVTGNSADNETKGQVIISFPYMVDKVVVEYWNNDASHGAQRLGIGGFTFCHLSTADSDADGVPNYKDLDSDNDGIPDVIESYGVDANGDGKIDNFTDANSNGASDNLSACTNLLTDGSFESPVQTNLGNNLTGLATFGLWSMDATGTFNIIKTNGSVYTGGPDNAQNGNQYVDVTNAADYFQQQVTVTSTATVTFGGYFASREQSGAYVNWTGSIDILNSAGTVVATSTTKTFVNADGAEEQVWYYLSGTATLPAGNYFYRVYLGDAGNFDNATFTACYTDLGLTDQDGDGVPNYIDLDSDGDGIPDVVEAGGTDANNDGIIDSYTDTDSDGYSDNVDGDVGNDGTAENSANALILSGADTNGDARADSWPKKNADLIGYPNPYDLDSDGDGLLDLIEAGFSGTNGVASGTLGTDGWSNTIDALASLNLPNTDGVGPANYLDIDSDNDGITDNVEAQSTTSYKVPTDKDKDGDGINDIYETTPQIGVYGGGGLTAYDRDGDTTPDYRDTDTDNDGVPDRNEGDRNAPFVTIVQATIDASGDTDGDGLMDVFDNNSITSLTTGSYYKNVTMGNMGALGGLDGPTPTSSLIGLQQSDAAGDRDWRNASILPLHIINFTVNYKSPIANIKWDVANELQTHYYEVEMSLNGTDFETVQKVGARNVGSSSYTFPHSLANQPSGTIYYRIKQVDKDNKTFYTQIITVKIAKASIPLTVSPNPFQSFINIAYTSELKGAAAISIFSADGKLLLTKRAEVVKGTNSIQFASLESLPSGTYILKLEMATSIQTAKLIKP
jgi:hypothetical protein